MSSLSGDSLSSCASQTPSADEPEAIRNIADSSLNGSDSYYDAISDVIRSYGSGTRCVENSAAVLWLTTCHFSLTEVDRNDPSQMTLVDSQSGNDGETTLQVSLSHSPPSKLDSVKRVLRAPSRTRTSILSDLQSKNGNASRSWSAIKHDKNKESGAMPRYSFSGLDTNKKSKRFAVFGPPLDFRDQFTPRRVHTRQPGTTSTRTSMMTLASTPKCLKTKSCRLSATTSRLSSPQTSTTRQGSGTVSLREDENAAPASSRETRLPVRASVPMTRAAVSSKRFSDTILTSTPCRATNTKRMSPARAPLWR